MIGQWRQKLANQAVLTGVQFDPIQAAVAGVTGGLSEALDHGGDIVGVHGLGQFAAIDFRDWRGRPQRQLGIMAAALHPAMGQVRQRQRAMAMQRIRDLAITVHHGGLVAEYRVLVGPVRRVNDAAFQNDRSRATGGTSFVISDVPFGEAVMGGEVGLMSGEYETVRRGFATQRQWGEKPGMAILRLAHGLASRATDFRYCSDRIHGDAMLARCDTALTGIGKGAGR